MKLYQTPQGTWAGSEAAWKDAMKAEGSDPKEMKRNTVEVPTKKADLMEFLTFHGVNILCPQGVTPSAAAPTSHPPHEAAADTSSPTTVSNLQELFAAAPISAQIELAVQACDNADAEIKRLAKVEG